ncbi:MAG: sigma-54-dependent Fis family transcriptional regulator [Candidatus Angelobacter sp. Gp1-AA117]|nr:MAG: sigma-54-dependent Fis family transcriptional regulator [Candidatus Angelobacter sp. Gp1-AA117]
MGVSAQAITGDAAFVSLHYLSLLIVDDERWIRESCKEVAEHMGFKVHTAENAIMATRILETESIDVALLDIRLPGPDGLELLLKIKKQQPETEVIMMTAHATVDSVLAAMKTGAYDYLRKPFNLEELKILLQRVTDTLRFSLENRITREHLKSNPGYAGIVGRSPEMEKLYRMIAKVASSRHPVLIQGENGTGKEMVARAIHFTGEFCDRPFIPVDCGSMAPAFLESELFGYIKGAFSGAVRSKEGLLSIVNGGTIFLDEIGEMPMDLQAKLLRALYEKEIRPCGGLKPIPINVRIIAATSRDMDIAVQQGTFRRELLMKLSVVSPRIPPLRERKDDIRLLVDHLLDRISRATAVRRTISHDAMKILLAYDWPGNVRELENCLERSMALSSSPVLNAADLPAQVQSAVVQANTPAKPPKNKIISLIELEKNAIINALNQLDGDKLMTARMLGIGKTTLYRKLKEYGITDYWGPPLNGE